MSRLSISSSFLDYCHLRCSLDGILLNLGPGREDLRMNDRTRVLVVTTHSSAEATAGARVFTDRLRKPR